MVLPSEEGENTIIIIIIIVVVMMDVEPEKNVNKMTTNRCGLVVFVASFVPIVAFFGVVIAIQGPIL